MNAAEQFALSRDARVPAVGLRLLAPGETHRLRARGGVQLCAMAGCLWVTESGVDADRFVGAGQSVLIGGRGRVVIECVSDQAALPTRADRWLRGTAAKLTADRVGYMAHPD